VLGVLFEQDPEKNPLGNPSLFIEASIAVAHQLSAKVNSFHAMLGQATVVHHVARTSGQQFEEVQPSRRQSAFVFRNSHGDFS
jgi:hypothetical protein